MDFAYRCLSFRELCGSSRALRNVFFHQERKRIRLAPSSQRWKQMSRILIIEDEPGLVMALTQRLSSEGYDFATAEDGDLGLALGLNEPFDVIILDVMLPQKNGFDVCRDLRRHGIEIPVILLPGPPASCSPTSKHRTGESDIHQFGALRVDFRRTLVSRDNKTVNLSAREFKLLRYLIEHSGATVSRDELLNEVWGYNTATTTRTVDV